MLGRLATGLSDYVQHPSQGLAQQLENARSKNISRIEWVLGSACLDTARPDVVARHLLESKISISGVTLNALMHLPLDARVIADIKRWVTCLSAASKGHAFHITVPLFENAACYSADEILALANIAKDAGVSIALECSPQNFCSISSRCRFSDEFRFVLDFGNLSFDGTLQEAEKLVEKGVVTIVHLKDKSSDGANCPFGSGVVSWEVVAETIQRIGKPTVIYERFVTTDWFAAQNEYSSISKREKIL